MLVLHNGVHVEGHPGVTMTDELLNLCGCPPVFEEQAGDGSTPEIMRHGVDAHPLPDLVPDPPPPVVVRHGTASWRGHEVTVEIGNRGLLEVSLDADTNISGDRDRATFADDL